ncbi:MAG: hypothetical protein K2O36_06105, partial [Ruminococcus sp.]|nr:hypothetical protein [Ruminococcus sp.]
MKKILCTFAVLALFLTGCGNEIFIPDDVGEDIPSQAISSENASVRKKRIEKTTVTFSQGSESHISDTQTKVEEIITSSAVSKTSEKINTKISDVPETSDVSETQAISNPNAPDNNHSDDSSQPSVTTKNNSNSKTEQPVTESPTESSTEAYYL